VCWQHGCGVSCISQDRGTEGERTRETATHRGIEEERSRHTHTRRKVIETETKLDSVVDSARHMSV
jgi:hypothetical protein